MVSRQASSNRNIPSTLACILSCTIIVLISMTSPTEALKKNPRTGYQVDIDGLTNLLQSLDSHLANFEKRTCAVGLNGHNCALNDLSNLMRSRQFLSSGFSPGKRSSPTTSFDAPQALLDQAKALQDDVIKQRRNIWRLKTLVEAARRNEEEEDENDVGAVDEDEQVSTKKRSCRLRLGGHCLTEELDRAASQYYYLKSPDSPGRKRRSSSKHVVDLTSSTSLSETR